MNYIFFGILHLIALCMLTYPLFKHLPTAIILLIGITIAVIGFWFESFYVESANLFWIGLINKDFAAGDFFPVFPNLGFFLIGISIGRTLYKNKESLLPNFPHDNLIINSLSWLGKNSLFVYLGHQPIAYVICLLLYNIKT